MGYFPYLNRNKKSLVVDLKAGEGKEDVRRLLGTTDILIENYAPGTMDRLGFGYDQLKEPYPHLIYCSLKGFLPGPYEKRMALDEVVQMMSGLAYMTGRPGDPLRAGASVIDMTTGIYGVLGVLLALRDRERTGRGQLVTSALFETAVFLMGHHMAYSAVSQQPVPPMPARVSAWGIYHQFEVQGGERVFIGVTSDKQWPRFCHAFGREDWLHDERLATNNGRIDHRDHLLPELAQMLADMPKAEAIAKCEVANLPFSPIARPEDLFDDPQLNEGGSLLETVLPDGRLTKLPRQPVLLENHDWQLRSQPPEIGEHNEEILG
jgi:crotonobetainyl-CoA:carnitine CoA-transferase CaiB-like acyl-CoA transferase